MIVDGATIALGTNSLASGQTAAVAIASNATATGETSIAIGGASYASGRTGVAIGAGTLAAGDSALALGNTSWRARVINPLLWVLVHMGRLQRQWLSVNLLLQWVRAPLRWVLSQALAQIQRSIIQISALASKQVKA